MTKINHSHLVKVNLGLHSYPIYIGCGLLSEPEMLINAIKSKQVFIVTNEIVASHYLARITQAFKSFQCDWIILPDGEQYKNITTWVSIFDKLIEKQHHRDTTLLALGGGVIGDMAGFAAACYQRGVNFIQIPTTLLAQVDAAIGGKTGINHPLGKNMIGAFYQPRSVIIDTETLKTLPAREFKAGLAEVIKYALLADREFFNWLADNLPQVLTFSQPALNYMIAHCCQLKANVVAEDEKESGRRALLNLGHTFAHALETATVYQEYLHGEAVAIGLYCASLLSHYLGNIDNEMLNRIATLLKSVDLPTSFSKSINVHKLLALMATDKKILNGKLRLVLLKTIGDAYVTDDINPDLIIKTLQQVGCEPK